MDAGKVIGFGLLAVGGYWLLEELGIVPCVFGCTAAATPVATPATNTTNTTASTSVTASQAVSQTGIATASTIQKVEAKMVAAGDDPTKTYTVYGWNYYYTEVTGVPGPDPSLVLPNSANPDSELIDINTWWAGMQNAGFSGLRGMGLGVIANRTNPYSNPMGRPFGNYAPLLGSERMSKRVN
jgi:hypothetical protein